MRIVQFLQQLLHDIKLLCKAAAAIEDKLLLYKAIPASKTDIRHENLSRMYSFGLGYSLYIQFRLRKSLALERLFSP